MTSPHPADTAPRPEPSAQGPRVRPAAKPARLKARSRPPVVRFARMTTGMVVQKAAFAYALHLRRDPVAALFRGSREDPYSRYEQLRALGPMPRSALGFRYTTDHALSSQILSSRAFGVSSDDPDDTGFEGDLDLSLLQLNPPDHTRLRRVVTPAFGRGRMAGYEQRVTATVDRLLDDVPRDDARDARWVEPRLVGEVYYTELTGPGRLRTPVWRGWRPDLDPADVTWE